MTLVTLSQQDSSKLLVRLQGIQRAGPANLLEQIQTDTEGAFSFSDALAARLKNNMKEEGTGNMLSQWKTRGLIEALTDGRFKKLPLNDKSSPLNDK